MGKIPEDKQVNHKNGIRNDNRLENLEIVSRSENIKHSYDVLKRKTSFGIKHKRNQSGFSNISPNIIRGLFRWVVTIRRDGKRFEKNNNNIYNILVIHNSYMRSINKPELIHKLKQEDIKRYGTGYCSLLWRSVNY